MKEPCDITTLRELIRYDAATGKLYWLPRGEKYFTGNHNKTAEQLANWWNNRFAGSPALDAPGVYGCRAGKLFGRHLYAHQAAWALHHGYWPEGEVLHDSGDRADNRPGNLLDGSHAENMQNKRLYKNGNGVVHGIQKRFGKWQAHYRLSGTRKQIGTFICFGQAVLARKAAERQEFHRNHGRAA